MRKRIAAITARGSRRLSDELRRGNGQRRGRRLASLLLLLAVGFAVAGCSATTDLGAPLSGDDNYLNADGVFDRLQRDGWPVADGEPADAQFAALTGPTRCQSSRTFVRSDSERGWGFICIGAPADLLSGMHDAVTKLPLLLGPLYLVSADGQTLVIGIGWPSDTSEKFADTLNIHGEYLLPPDTVAPEAPIPDPTPDESQPPQEPSADHYTEAAPPAAEPAPPPTTQDGTPPAATSPAPSQEQEPASRASAGGSPARRPDPAQPPPDAGSRNLGIYLLYGDRLIGVHRAVHETPAVGTAALHALLDGPGDDERDAAIETALPADMRLQKLTISGGEAVVTLTSRQATLPPAALAQIVYTLTEFPTVTRVTVAVNGDRMPTVTRAELAGYDPTMLDLLVYFVRDGRLAAYPRIVPRTRAVGAAALNALLAGPTAAERAQGASTDLAPMRLRKLTIGSARAQVTLAGDASAPLSASGRAQVAATLKQFPTIERVEISVGP